MLRMLVAGAVLWTAPACAKHDADSAEPRVAMAGKVTQVAGTVTATGGGSAARALAVGDVLASNDIIQTTAGSTVDIVLDRNGALLHLDQGQTVELDHSVAWTLPQQLGSGSSTSSEGVASAGRPSENSSAHTMAPGPQSKPGTTTQPTPIPAQDADQQAGNTPSDPQKPQQMVSPPKRVPAPIAATPNVGRLSGSHVPKDDGDGLLSSGDHADKSVGHAGFAPTAAQLATLRACFAQAATTLELDVDTTGAATAGTHDGAAVSPRELACLTSAIRAIGAPPAGHVSLKL